MSVGWRHGAGDGCVFCAIVNGAEPAAVIYEDEVTLAFLDITAVTKGHSLAIPKRHVAYIWDASADDMASVTRTVHHLARRTKSVLCPDGMTLFQANCGTGWQDVFHLHVHIVPRYEGDRLQRPWVARPVELASLDPVRAALASPAAAVGGDDRLPTRA